VSVEETNTDGAKTNDGAANNDGLAQELANITAALKAEREAKAAIKAQLDAAAEAQAEAERKKAEESGKFEELYGAEKSRAEQLAEQLQSFQERESARIEAVTAEADAIVAAWDDADKALDPKGLDADQRLSMLRKLDARLKAASNRPAGNIAGNSGKSDVVVNDFVREHYRSTFQRDGSPEELKVWSRHLAKTSKFRDKLK